MLMFQILMIGLGVTLLGILIFKAYIYSGLEDWGYDEEDD